MTFGNVHEVFTGGSGAAFTAGLVELLQFANRARNCHIHNAGLANKPLVQARIDLDPAHALHWQRVTGKVIPAYKLGDHVPLGVAELVGALHLIKAIGEEANRAFQDACPRGRWADILVEDWQLTSKPGNDNQRWRRLIGMARHEYGPLELTEAEVGAAFRRAA